MNMHCSQCQKHLRDALNDMYEDWSQGRIVYSVIFVQMAEEWQEFFCNHKCMLMSEDEIEIKS